MLAEYIYLNYKIDVVFYCMALLEITDEAALLDLTSYPPAWDPDGTVITLHVLAVISP